ncbi:hypothetical protein RIR_e4368_A0A2I1HGU9_9GLOMa [Rhizophagus irregularis DAOM 181602=DAOM 197198]|nr:hypothetical protein RIR_e4368_A0A2I1HGU9_9GLOMa [Rhizophagus irregularis DAOM 181602=DAOM 197198]
MYINGGYVSSKMI